MNFELSAEQQMLCDSLQRFVTDHYSLEQRMKLAGKPPGYSQAHWQQFAELGWLALPFAEADGGLGGNMVDVMLLMEQFGKGLVLEPYLPTVVLGGNLLRRTLDGARREQMLGDIMGGKIKCTLATTEQESRWDLHHVLTSARKDGADYLLNGNKSVVPMADSADLLIVSARTSGSAQERQGISLFLVDAKADGVQIEGYATVDGQRAAEVHLQQVRVPEADLLGQADAGQTLLDAVSCEATLALCAEALGGLERLYKDTIEYTGMRQQFDHPLADFQTVQHRLVEMFMEYEQCKSMLYRATLEYVQQGQDAARSISGCKYLIGEAGRFIAETAVQLHGGMGVTEELPIGHYFKRQLVIENQFGDSDYHLSRFASIPVL